MVVQVYDGKGLNFTIKSKNALEIVTSLLHSIKAYYFVIDLTHSDRDKGNDVDYQVFIDA